MSNQNNQPKPLDAQWTAEGNGQSAPCLSGAFPMDKGCVTIDDWIPECCEECGDEDTSQPPAVKAVRILLPTLGMDMIVGKYCEPCSKLICERMQASLPDEVDE